MKYLVSAVIGANKVVQRVVMVLCAVSAVAVPTLALISVASRYIPGFTATWSAELTQAATLIMVMMGATLGYYRYEHVRITLVEGWTRGWSPRTARYIALLSLGLFGLGMVIVGIPLLESVEGQTTPMLRLPLWIPYSSVVVAGVAFVLHTIAYLLGFRGPEDAVPAQAAAAGPVPGDTDSAGKETLND